MEELYIIDRIEGNIVIVESPTGEMINVSKESIKGNFREGDCLIQKDNYYMIDREATVKRKEQVARMMKGMWQS